MTECTQDPGPRIVKSAKLRLVHFKVCKFYLQKKRSVGLENGK